MKDAVLLLVGAVLGVVVDRLSDLFWERHKRRRTQKGPLKRRELDVQQTEDILDAFSSQGLERNLYQTETFGAPLRLSILHDETIIARGVLEPHLEEWVFITEPELARLPYDERLVRKKQRQGANLWDGPILYSLALALSPNGQPQISAGVCNFFAFVTLKERLRVAARTQRGSGLLEENFRDVRSALHSSARPVMLAAAVACVFESEEGPQIAIQRRSDAVASVVGTLGVIPLFGLESNVRDGTRSRYNVLTYNFLKEFLEEFYGLEDLVRASSSSRLHPDWIFETLAGRALAAELDAGRLSLHLMGMGVETLDGSLVFAMVAHFQSRAFLDQLKFDCNAGWESVGRNDELPIRFLPIASAELGSLVLSGEMRSSSAFVLDLMRKRFASDPLGGSTQPS